MNYIDDWLAVAQADKVNELAVFVKGILTYLGWLFNDKTDWVPSFTATVLGFLVDAEKHVVAVPRDKIQRIKALIGGSCRSDTETVIG